MANNTQIRCVCGSTLSTAIPELITNFDAIHGTIAHQNEAMQIEKERNEIGRVKWGMNK